MEKLTVVGTFQKSVDALKIVECSSKEKLNYFSQITECIQSVPFRANPNYLNHLSTAISVLLLFCEEIDSVIRMNAEENLYKIIRFCENNNNIIRVQIDLYHEIKKNGNEKSLRICLHLFGYYCHTIKQRKAKSYAQNLLPCVYAVSKRKETLVIESLCEFMKIFCLNLQICMSDNEVLKMIEIFVGDSISECAVKRRCSTQNVISLIENSRNREYFGMCALSKCLEISTRDQHANTVIGVLGLLRVLIPIILEFVKCDIQQTLEIYDLCLHYLNETNHTIINAALEVINTILSADNESFRKMLINEDLEHRDLLFRKKTLKNTIFRNTLTESHLSSRKSSSDTIKNDSKISITCNPNDDVVSSSDESKKFLNPRMINPVEDKSVTSSDVEMESFKSIDMDTEIALSQSVLKIINNEEEKKDETASLKSQKSTESISSFFNNLLSHSNTETVSKFFRTRSTESPLTTPKSLDKTFFKYSDDDNLSIESLGSHISGHSSATDILISKETTILENVPSFTEIVRVDQDHKSPMKEIQEKNDTIEFEIVPDESNKRDLFIGTIYDQNILEYTIRLIASKFLLTGVKHNLVQDQIVRVSIKSLSLLVIANCVQLKPQYLLSTLEKINLNDSDEVLDQDDIFELLDDLSDENEEQENVTVEAVKDEELLEIKDDHFGECTTSYFDYFSPMSLSLDQGLISLKSKMKASQEKSNENNNAKLSKELDKVLSKSDYVEKKSHRMKTTPLITRTVIKSFVKSEQSICEILLFYNHNDPILRGNVQILIGNFIKAIHTGNQNYNKFIETYTNNKEVISFMNYNRLLRVLINGLNDEIHTVVKLTLVSIEGLVSILLRKTPLNQQNVEPNQLWTVLNKSELNNILLNKSVPEIVTNKMILDELNSVFDNKYWLVQCKYSEIIASINYHDVELALGGEFREIFEEMCMNHLLLLLNDSDFRVRNQASKSLCSFLTNISNANDDKQLKPNNVVCDFIDSKIFNELPEPLNLLNKTFKSNDMLLQKLAETLYYLTNKLLEIQHKNDLFGVVNAIKELLHHFNPIHYVNIWKESNVLSVIVSFLNENISIGLDLTCQSDLLHITSILLAAFETQTVPNHDQDHPLLSGFIIHCLKILTIYHHLLSNTKPLMIPINHKSDLFITPKELQMMQSFGYFGNEYFYSKFYNILKNSFESYKITINKESGAKMIQLLETLLISINRTLEIKSITNIIMTNGTKFVQEVLGYLQSLFNFSPKLCIKTTKCLLVFHFGHNYKDRRLEYENIIQKSEKELHLIGDFGLSKNELMTVVLIDGSKLDYSSYIKYFEPIVIQCLKLFTKSNFDVQTNILEIICQLLNFKVNYYLLDANNVFIDFVLNYLDMIIEKGSIRNSHILLPKIIEFLFHLTKSSDKKLISIPKIINITDQLLANNLIRKTGIAALLTLCFEIYFKQPRSSTNSELMLKEMDTQKEVVLSMMIKFLDDVEIQNLLSVLTLLERDSENSTTQEDILSNVFQLLLDNKITIIDEIEYNSLNNLFSTFSRNILLMSKNIEIIIEIYSKLIENKACNLNQISVFCIIFEHILYHTEEIYFMNLLKLSITKQKESTMLNEQQYFVNLLIKSLENSFNHGTMLNVETTNKTLFDNLLKKYLKYLITILLKFSTITNLFKIELNNSSTLLFMKITNYEVRSIWLELLIDIGYDLNYILTQFVQYSNDNLDEKSLKINLYRKILSEEDNTQIPFSLNEDIVNSILEHSFDLFLYEFNEILCQYVKEETYSCLIIFKLKEFLDYRKDNVDELVLVKYILRVLKKANINTFSGSLDLLLNQEYSMYSNEIILKRIGEILKKKLDLVLKTKSNDIETMISVNDFKLMEAFCEDKQNYEIYAGIKDTLRTIATKLNIKMMKIIPVEINYDYLRNKVIDETWFLEQINIFSTSTTANDIDNRNATNFLLEVKSESKLINVLSSKNLNNKLLSTAIQISFKTMVEIFRIECVAFNPHINYLKIPPLLKVAIIILIKKIDSVIHSDQDSIDGADFESYIEAVIVLIKNLMSLEELCLIYVDAKHVEKFINDNLLKMSYIQSFIKISTICLERIDRRTFNSKHFNLTEAHLYLSYCKQILSYRCIWNEFNNANEEYNMTKELYIKVIFNYFNMLLKNSKMIREYINPTLFNDLDIDIGKKHLYLSLIFVARYFDNPDSKNHANREYGYLLDILEPIEKLAVLVMKIYDFYLFAITPYDALLNYDKTLLITSNKLPSIPIDYLNDVDILQKFVRRVNIFGFSSRQQFEELFMTSLLLINTKNDPDMIDIQEQYEIKNMCLYAITELLLSCHKYPSIGFSNQHFFHFARLSPIKPNNICLKKLHNIQLILPPASNIFYQGNLERNVSDNDNLIGTKRLQLNQFSIDFIWQTIDDSNFVANKDISINKNSKYFIEKSGIDLKSSMQLIFDVFSQLIEENHVLILSHLVKLSDICCSRDQFKWINTTMLGLQERVPREDTLSHQHIIYLLCKSYAVIIPSMSELTQLCTIIPQYLKSTQLFIRTATLNGLLCLLECFVKTNTTIGSLNDELQMLRNIIIGYIVKHGIIEESQTQLSDYHTKLVWTLNFYLIETTTKFVPECNLLSNTIISANNILKRTTNLDIYLCILHGLERLVVTNTTTKLYREKIENLSLELVKLDNELFSIPALKLLISCMYMNSSEQLENTEKSNGIVQDEPEIIMASTEKIEVLFARIRSSTPYGATIIGNTLCQIIKDLLPPNEILTRCIKEFLVLSQPHPSVIAKITYQLFRSAIDASYLSMLQDWLIFSLPNFLQFQQINKVIWSLTIIFISTSLNQFLLKMFPKILNVAHITFSQNICDNDIQLFILSAKDFYDKLSAQQKDRFRIVFQNKTDNSIFLNMLQSL